MYMRAIVLDFIFFSDFIFSHFQVLSYSCTIGIQLLVTMFYACEYITKFAKKRTQTFAMIIN